MNQTPDPPLSAPPRRCADAERGSRVTIANGSRLSARHKRDDDVGGDLFVGWVTLSLDLDHNLIYTAPS